MTAARTTPATTLARPTGFVHDLITVAGRAIRDLRRDPEAVIPPLIIATFFYAINVGSLQKVIERGSVNFDYKAFQLPTAIIFAVTGVSRATSLVVDIQSGFFDRLLVTPVRRLVLLLGFMVADLVLVMALTTPVIIAGLVVGVRFQTGVLGMLAFVLIAAFWAVSYSGIIYAIALKTGSPTAVGQSFLLFFPFAFLTTGTVPRSAMTGWLASVVPYNPLTYLLDGFRSLITEGWVTSKLLPALLAISVVGVVSISMALLALRGRVSRS